MASQYRTDFLINERFPDVLKDFTREILRNQPKDLNQFGYDYFSELALRVEDEPTEPKHVEYEEEEADRPVVHALAENAEELELLLRSLFEEADKDGNGYLDHSEFKEIMRTADLGLSSKDIHLIMSEADENDDGTITYEEFVPLAVETLVAMKAKEDAREDRAHKESDAQVEAEVYLLHGMTREELTELIGDIFKTADTDGTGSLSRKEFKECLQNSNLGFTRKEINRMMLEADTDGDGQVSYGEFVPIAYDLLVDSFKAAVLEEVNSDSELEQYFLDLFGSQDAESTGKLKLSEIRDLLREADLGITRLQIFTLLSEAEPDDEGYVKYSSFASTCATMIVTMFNTEVMAETAAVLQEIQDMDEHELMNINRDDFEDKLRQIFSEWDKDQNGYLDPKELREALSSGRGLELSQKEITGLMVAVDEDDDGKVSYDEFCTHAFDIFKYLSKKAHVDNMIEAKRA